jgi:uncharacterized protein
VEQVNELTGATVPHRDAVVEELRAQVTEFAPLRWSRSPYLQSAMATVRPWRLRSPGYRELPMIVDAGRDLSPLKAEDVRLLGYYSPQLAANGSAERPKGFVISLHGWEGCSHSTYNVILVDALTRAGYEVFRLNLRDHGPHLHINPFELNRGMFMGTLIEEAHLAVQRVAEMAAGLPVYLIGPSMGGNFVLRMAVRHNQAPIPNLHQVIAISPAVNPCTSIARIDSSQINRIYFRRRWVKSLLAKAEAYPELYDVEELVRIPLIKGMTDRLIRDYTEMSGADEYLQRYAVDPDSTHDLSVPVTILAAEDDGVIPIQDIRALAPHLLLKRHITPYGGHVGFVSGFPLQHRLPELVLGFMRPS